MNYQKKLLSMGFIQNEDGDFEMNVLDINITVSILGSDLFKLWVYNYGTEREAIKCYKTFTAVEKNINKLIYE